MTDQPKPPVKVDIHSTLGQGCHLISVFLHHEMQLDPQSVAALQDFLKTAAEFFVSRWEL